MHSYVAPEIWKIAHQLRESVFLQPVRVFTVEMSYFLDVALLAFMVQSVEILREPRSICHRTVIAVFCTSYVRRRTSLPCTRHARDRSDVTCNIGRIQTAGQLRIRPAPTLKVTKFMDGHDPRVLKDVS